MISLLKLSMVSYTTGVDDMIDDFIFYLISALLIFYAGYKYQKDSKFIFTIFGGKSLVAILLFLISSIFSLSILLEILGYSITSYYVYEINYMFMMTVVSTISVMDMIYYRIKKKKKD